MHKIKPRGFWTKKHCAEVALKYTNRTEFHKYEIGAYTAAKKNGWFDEICQHMQVLWEPKWNKDKCIEEARKCHSVSQFRSKSWGAFAFAKRNNILDEVCSHIIVAPSVPKQKSITEKNKPQTVFTFDECKQIASKYSSKKGFFNNSTNCYKFAKKNNWLDEICEHMNYTLEQCREIARSCQTIEEFRKTNKQAYLTAYRNKWLEDICTHMNLNKKLRGHWTKENCSKVALLCQNRTEFSNKYPSAVEAASKNGWMNEICQHMVSSSKPNGYWNIKQNCLIESKKYPTRTQFARNCPGAYQSCIEHGWLEEACQHMTIILRKDITKEDCAAIALTCKSQAEMEREYPRHYGYAYRHKILKEIFAHIHYPEPLTLEKVKKAALDCKFRQEFLHKYPREFRYAERHHIMKEITKHMYSLHGLNKRCVYAAEFSDNCVYVGLTCSFERRKKEHLEDPNSAVHIHINESGLMPNISIKHDYVDFMVAKDLEGIILREYLDSGWIGLNRTGTGGIGTGGTLASQIKACTERIKFCKDYIEFEKRFPDAYKICKENDWFDMLEDYLGEIQDQLFVPAKFTQRKKMPLDFVRRMKGQTIAFRYTDEELIEELKKYKNKTILRSKNFSAYKQAQDRNILDTIFPNNDNEVPDEQIVEEAKLFKSRKEFEKKNNAHYQLARKRHILDQACAHMKYKGYGSYRTMKAREQAESTKYWTHDKIIEHLRTVQYDSITDFIQKESGAYNAARNLDMLDEIKTIIKPKVQRWDYDRIAQEAKKYKTKFEFQTKSSKAYNAAHKRGILDDVCSHMTGKKSWKNIESIKKEALKYDLISEFIKHSCGAYNAALKLGIIEEVCSHMRKPKRLIWKHEELVTEAQKYESRGEFKKGSPGAYQCARKRKVLDEICQHMKSERACQN